MASPQKRLECIKLFPNMFTSSGVMLFMGISLCNSACPRSLGESEAEDEQCFLLRT